MRPPTEHHVVRDGHAHRHVRCLRHHRHAPSQLHAAQSADVVATDGDIARELGQARDGAQDAALPGAVWPDQGQPLARRHIEVNLLYRIEAPIRDREVAQADRTHSSAALVERMTAMKNGAPMKAVSTPMDSSAGATTVRAAVSARTRNAPPKNMLRGITTL